MVKHHKYSVHVDWEGGREGSGEVKAETSGAVNALSVPPEYGGPGEGTNPEELLTSAIASCYSMTFGAVAKNRGVPLTSVKTVATGDVEEKGQDFTYKKITIEPSIKLAASATDEDVTAALDAAQRADRYCIVTNTLRGRVEIEVKPEVVKE